MARRLTRRQFLLAGSAVTLAGFALSGCTAASAPDSSAGNAVTSTETGTEAQQAEGTSVTFAHSVGGTENGWYPIYGYWGNETNYVATLGHTRLIEFGDQQSVHPGLASEWEVSPDSSQFTFHLRDDITFADGQPVTVEDVVFTFRFLCSDAINFVPANLADKLLGYDAFHNGETEDLAGVTTPDDHTVVFTLEKPLAGWHEFALTETPILPEHIYKTYDLHTDFKEQFAPAWFSPEINMGSGPFQVTHIEQDKYIEMVRNDNFYLGTPKLDKVWFKNFGSVDTQFIALQQGELDVWNVPPDYLEQVRALPNVTVTEMVSLYTRRIEINWRQPYLADKRVRQALLYAINRDGLCNELQNGACVPLNTFMAPPLWQAPDLEPYEYNPDKAKQLLDEAGWDPNQVIRLTYYYTDAVTRDLIAAVQADLANVGVQLEPRQIENAVYNDQAASCDFDMSYAGSATGYPTKYDFNVGAGCQKVWEDPEITSLMEEARASADETQRHELLNEVQAQFNDFLPQFPMFKYKRFIAINNRVQNVTADDIWLFQHGNTSCGYNNIHNWTVA